MAQPGLPNQWVVTLDPTDGPNATNLIPNPSFEYDTVGSAPAAWATTGNFDTAGATLTCQTGSAQSGVNTMRIVSNGSSANEGAECAMSGTFTSGLPYTFQVALKGNAGGETLKIKLGTGADNAASATLTLTTAWQVFSVTWTPGANRTGVTAAVQFVPSTAQTVFADAAIVVQASSVTNYFDGDTHMAPASSYQWSGTPGNSTSTRTNTRTTLDINNPTSGIMIGGTSTGQGPDWGTSQITEYTAQQSRYGSTVADYVWPNRTITIPIVLGTQSGSVDPNTALQSLRQKVALFQREGGWLKRQRSGGLSLYADVVDAQLAVPDAWGEGGHFEPGVTLTLTCLPDFYGDEIVCDVAAATGVYTGVVTQSGSTATISGDHPARTPIIVTDKSGNNQLSVLWGVRSKNYDPAATAALTYEAEVLTPVNGAAVTGLSGASNTQVVAITGLPAASWVTMLSTTIASGTQPLTHKGSYRVWARCYSSTGTPSFQLQWGVGSLSVPTTNTSVTLPGSGAYYLLDLGEVRLDAPPVGTNQWFGAVQTYSSAGGDFAAVDVLYLQPLDEAAGQLTYVYEAPPSSISVSAPPTTGVNDAATGSVAWTVGTGTLTSCIETINDVGVIRSLTTGQTSEWMKAMGYGFNIPSGATILGVQAVLYWMIDSGSGFTWTARLSKAGTVQTGAPSSAVTQPYAPDNPGGFLTTYGGPTDLWGGTWASSDINNSGFGFAASVTSPSGSGQVEIDYMGLTIYYHLASGFTVVQDAVVYASQTTHLRNDGMWRTAGSNVYGPVSNVVGDLARIPPSGVENRPCQVFIKPSRGDLDLLPDSGLDSFAVQVQYQSCWIFRP